MWKCPRRPAVLLLLTLAGAVAAAPSVAEAGSAEDPADLLKTDKAFAQVYAASDNPMELLREYFLEDARVLPPDAPMARGREEALAVFAALDALPAYKLRWSPLTGDTGGDLGYTIGTYHMEFQDPQGNDVSIDGKYMTVWKRQSDGAWKVAVDMFNANGSGDTAGE